jgi:peptide/nickel transport system permease protein
VVIRHAVKNATIPVLTHVAVQLPVVIGGAVIVEEIFQLPGMGRLLVDAVGRRDYPLVSGINVVFAAVVVLVNLLTDVTYSWLDPRVRHE